VNDVGCRAIAHDWCTLYCSVARSEECEVSKVNSYGLPTNRTPLSEQHADALHSRPSNAPERGDCSTARETHVYVGCYAVARGCSGGRHNALVRGLVRGLVVDGGSCTSETSRTSKDLDARR
jgi:hypothetical protein